MKLYDYFRSSAAYRVRIALNLKGLAPEREFVHLRHGAQRSDGYLALNPQGLVPALALDGGEVLTQSLAIIEYLDEVYPDPPLLPADDIERAQVRAAAQLVACDIHPLNNTSTLNYLKGPLQQDQAAVDAWYRYWVENGFAALETMLRPGPYAFGSRVTIADLCLVPQVFNARRFKADLSAFPKIAAVEAACLKLPAFDKARPENQPDAE